MLREYVVRHSMPEAAIGVLRDGTVTTACYRAADVRTGEPVTPGTVSVLARWPRRAASCISSIVILRAVTCFRSRDCHCSGRPPMATLRC